MTTPEKKMKYGKSVLLRRKAVHCSSYSVVRLGSSGLKVSRIILGCMQYGLKEWADWVLDEEEAMKHIKYAYVPAPRHY